jgi:hypothetical protein
VDSEIYNITGAAAHLGLFDFANTNFQNILRRKVPVRWSREVRSNSRLLNIFALLFRQLGLIGGHQHRCAITYVWGFEGDPVVVFRLPHLKEFRHMHTHIHVVAPRIPIKSHVSFSQIVDFMWPKSNHICSQHAPLAAEVMGTSLLGHYSSGLKRQFLAEATVKRRL